VCSGYFSAVPDSIFSAEIKSWVHVHDPIEHATWDGEGISNECFAADFEDGLRDFLWFRA